jgi:surface protein
MEKLTKVMSAQTAADMLKEAVLAGQDSDPFQAVVDAVQEVTALPLAIMGLVNDFVPDVVLHFAGGASQEGRNSEELADLEEKKISKIERIWVNQGKTLLIDTKVAQALAGNLKNLKTIEGPGRVKLVGEMYALFANAIHFNGDVSRWNVENVTYMDSMFSRAKAFEGNGISTWKVGNVTDMKVMFWHAEAFNGDVSNWNVANVTIMDAMFEGAKKFEGGDLSRWEVSNVTDMTHMFKDAVAFNGRGLGEWRVGNVTNMNSMFRGAKAFEGRDLSGWAGKVGNVKFMTNMFRDARSFNAVMNGWNVSNDTKIENMFRGASSFDEDGLGWPS